MKVKVKKLNSEAIIPKYAHPTDAGLDLTAVSYERDSNNLIVYHTGLSIEIPEGYVGLIYPRSSISKYDLELTNSVGVIDSGYRGEILFKFRETTSHFPNIYVPGDRIGQLIIVPYPSIELEEVDELSSSDRSDKGFGSTGK